MIHSLTISTGTTADMTAAFSTAIESAMERAFPGVSYVLEVGELDESTRVHVDCDAADGDVKHALWVLVQDAWEVACVAGQG